MSAASELIKQVFSKGVSSVRKKALVGAFEQYPAKVHRYTTEPEKLMAEGFKQGGAPFNTVLIEQFLHENYPIETIKKIQSTGVLPKDISKSFEQWLLDKRYPSGRVTPEEVTDVFDTSGLYWFAGPKSEPIKKESHNFLAPWNREAEVVEGIRRPSALVEREQFTLGKEIAPYNAEADFIRRSRLGGPVEYIQQKPDNVLARYKDKFRILGITGALGAGGSMAIPDEAEAGPWKGFKWLPPGTKIAEQVRPAITKGPQSSAFERLSGKTPPGLEDRGLIKDVVKGQGDMRAIIFEDGTELPVRQSGLREIVRELRTQEYVGKLATKTPADQLKQAQISLEMHRNYKNPFDIMERQKGFRGLHGQYTKASMPEVENVPYVFVESEGFFMPEPYAKILDEAGEIQIKKRK